MKGNKEVVVIVLRENRVIEYKERDSFKVLGEECYWC